MGLWVVEMRENIKHSVSRPFLIFSFGMGCWGLNPENSLTRRGMGTS
jgi:hypothetical protein